MTFSYTHTVPTAASSITGGISRIDRNACGNPSFEMTTGSRARMNHNQTTEIPNSNDQIPNKFQVLILEPFGFWLLELIWFLVLRAWNLNIFLIVRTMPIRKAILTGQNSCGAPDR